MSNRFYDQPPSSVEEQILLLKSEGLSFPNEARAVHLLQNISMFRIKSYLLPFRREDHAQFKVGITFDDAYSIYKFDSELRKMVCAELEKIEVSVRTQLSSIMSRASGIYWFEDASNFKDVKRHSALLKSLDDELRRSDDDTIVGFKKKYVNPFPPSWMTFEISSFGTLSMMYKCLNAGHARREIAGFYGLSDTVMESWLHSVVYVRNICAHHSRLWNRQLSINAIIPRHTRLPFVPIPKDTRRVFYIMSIILYFLQSVNPQNTFAERFKALLAKYPMIDVTAMGFPPCWSEYSLWA